MKIFVGFAFTHHKGTHAGYHQIKDYIDYDMIIDCQHFFEKLSTPPSNLLCRIKRKIFRSIFGFPIFPFFMLRLIILGLTRNDLIIHYIYGENLYIPLLKWCIRKGNKIVCTLHQPLEWFQQQPSWISALKTIDLIILVGESEVDDFKKVTGHDNVIYIPHGIDTDYYHPNENIKKTPMVLTVGNWLRDYQFADKVYAAILERHPDWEIIVVADPAVTSVIRKHPHIKCLTRITDEELRMLYWKCRLLFLPLTRYTANNALLEASSCGCNIVIASNYNDNSYIPKQYIQQVKMIENDSKQAIYDNFERGINLLLTDYVAQNYSWKVIGEITEKSFDDL